MAVIPRYFSQRDAVPAINNVRMDPGTAAAPYKAAEQSNNQMLEIFQHELGAWGKVFQQKEAEQQAAQAKNQKIADGLYVAEASANMSMGANDIQHQVMQTSDGTTNHAALADGEFQKLVDSVVANAPSDTARMEVMKRAIKTRAGMYNKVSNQSIKANNQVNMDRIEGMLGQYELAASRNPDAVDEIKGQSEDVLNTLNTLGIPAHQQKSIRDKFTRNVDYHAVASKAEADPTAVLEGLRSGQFDHLGPKAVAKLEKVAGSSEKAMRTEVKASLVDVEKALMLGQRPPEDMESRFQAASKLGLTQELEDVSRLTDVANTLSGKKLPELIAAGAEIKQMIARGEIGGDPAKAKKLEKFINTQVKSIKQDPFAFSENQGSFKPFNTISDFTKLSPEEAQQRKFRALQIEESLGVKSPALKQAEIDVALAQLDSVPEEQKLSIIQNLSALGEGTISAVVSRADKKNDLGLAHAIRMSQINPKAAQDILKGRELIKTGAYKPDPALSKNLQPIINSVAVDESMKKSIVSASKAAHAANPSIDMEDLVSSSNNLIKMDRNGLFTGSYKMVAPSADLDQSGFENLIDSNLTKDEDWRSFGTGTPARTAAGKALPSNKIQPSDYDYVLTGDGKYKLMYEGSEVLKADGSPIKVDLVKLTKDRL